MPISLLIKFINLLIMFSTKHLNIFRTQHIVRGDARLACVRALPPQYPPGNHLHVHILVNKHWTANTNTQNKNKKNIKTYFF